MVSVLLITGIGILVVIGLWRYKKYYQEKLLLELLQRDPVKLCRCGRSYRGSTCRDCDLEKLDIATHIDLT
ncbi:MAG: hypothetical protein INQ03_10520 [Candidatus Heimdallarchaeota archaeon]|nr:hypothetical protein [Candidatus Heimdallarchaeota archaeon]